ncbi:MAG: ABC transporter substrate-binding protein, partial [Hyphomicrobiales bacterium]|nr:ABC transporter substrate-binding protein [Hyphomicrobiales bacterium]
MRKYLGLFLGLVGGVAVGALTSSTPSAADTIRIAHSTWVGYGPLYVARDKGIFKNHGIDVELIVMEDPKDRFPAMLADKIDMIAS